MLYKSANSSLAFAIRTDMLALRKDIYSILLSLLVTGYSLLDRMSASYLYHKIWYRLTTIYPAAWRADPLGSTSVLYIRLISCVNPISKCFKLLCHVSYRLDRTVVFLHRTDLGSPLRSGRSNLQKKKEMIYRKMKSLRHHLHWVSFS